MEQYQIDLLFSMIRVQQSQIKLLEQRIKELEEKK